MTKFVSSLIAHRMVQVLYCISIEVIKFLFDRVMIFGLLCFRMINKVFYININATKNTNGYLDI